ncbi:MAG: class I SAM-dependent methyltransferase [Ignavibacteriota bacterium]
MNKINYGLDAPKVIRNLIIIGLIIVLLTILYPIIKIGEVEIITSGFIWMGISFLIVGILMILYSKYGKFKHRDRILNLIEWNGSEKVLDVGTGLGLLMIGAAKKLRSGKSYGIDIFNTYDLSDNSIEQTKTNAKLESVSQKVEILKENILKTSFQDDYFDVVVSNLCLHNLYNSEDRIKACKEIHRITKVKGQVIISDFKNIKEYKQTFINLGMKVQKEGTYFFDTFPPLTIIKATKT